MKRKLRKEPVSNRDRYPGGVKITKTVRPTKLKDGTKAAVLRVVRGLISKNMENKQRGFILEQNVVHNAPITDADVVPIIGSITEGNSSLERDGDKIKPKSLVVRGVISTNPAYNPDNKPMFVHIYILTAKDRKTNALVQAGVGMSDFLKPNIGGTTQVAFDGSTQRGMYPVNSEKFKVYYQTRLLLAPGSAGAGTREFEALRWRYVFKSLPASLTFDEANGDDPNNFAPFLVIGYTYADGTVGETLQTRVISNAFSQLTFEDA